MRGCTPLHQGLRACGAGGRKAEMTANARSHFRISPQPLSRSLPTAPAEFCGRFVGPGVCPGVPFRACCWPEPPLTSILRGAGRRTFGGGRPRPCSRPFLRGPSVDFIPTFRCSGVATPWPPSRYDHVESEPAPPPVTLARVPPPPAGTSLRLRGHGGLQLRARGRLHWSRVRGCARPGTGAG